MLIDLDDLRPAIGPQGKDIDPFLGGEAAKRRLGVYTGTAKGRRHQGAIEPAELCRDTQGAAHPAITEPADDAPLDIRIAGRHP